MKLINRAEEGWVASAAMETVELRVVGCSSAEASVLIGELHESLHSDVRGVELTRRRDDPLAQDAGLTLVAVLATPTLVVLARGLTTWLVKRSEARLRMMRIAPDGTRYEVEVVGGMRRGVADAIREFLAA